MSNLVDHAKRELALAGNDEAFDNSIIKAVEAFASYGHSGGSASVGIQLLNDLLQFKNLTPLTDNPDEWIHIHEDVWEGDSVWQNCRNGEAFSNDEGKTYYLLSEGGNNQNRVPLHESVRFEEVKK